ncbi:MAG: hypothetical protein ACK5WX_04905 [bacterium]
MQNATIANLAGECRAFFAFEAAFAIDLARAAARFPASAREALPQSRRVPADADFSQKPLRIVVERAPIVIEHAPSLIEHAPSLIGAWRTETAVEVTLYDFGAVSVSFRIPIEASPAQLRTLAAGLWNNAALATAARACVEEVLATLGDAATRPELRGVPEDYIVFVVDPASTGGVAPSVAAFGAENLAALVQLEDQPLSAEEIADATANALAYGQRDLVLVDWAAAFVVDASPAATLAVLELANVQLVELKHLDSELDRGLDQVWAMANDRSLFSRFRLRANLRKLTELELEGAALFDGVTNALKLFGDASLARVQRAAGRRFRIEDWEKSIARKLETLGSVTERLESRQSQYRSELLEWIIIALIAFEIVRTFL